MSTEKTRTVVHEVLLFAGLRQRAGREALRVELAENSTVQQLLAAVAAAHPELDGPVQGCRVAVALEFVGPERTLPGGEEIALIPPVSGGHDGRPGAVYLGDTSLSLRQVVEAVEHAGAGGIATFTGNVRRHSRGETIRHLEYEAYPPMAVKVMAEIAQRIEADVPGARVAIHHRLGRLEVGESAVIIAASAPHRDEAFQACRAAIEALKADVPIWKREVSETGAEWIGRGP